MKNLMLLTLAIVSVCTFSSCKKEETKTKTKAEILTQKAWVMAKYEEKAGTAPWVDDFPNFDACDKDDQYVFRANGTYEINEGATKCDPTDPQVFASGNWTLKNGDTILDFDGEDFNLDQLVENSLVISLQESIGGTTYQIRLSFRNL
jgi:hypothetical protein